MTRKGFKAARRLGLLALLAALATPALFHADPHARAQTKPQTPVLKRPRAPILTDTPPPFAITSARIQPASVTKVNFKQLAEQAKRARLSPTTSAGRAAPIPGTVIDTPPGAGPANSPTTSPAAASDEPGGPLVPSPSPSQSFLAQ